MKTLLAFALVLVPVSAMADVISLTPEQAEAAKEAGAARNARAAELGTAPIRDRAVHGEVGISIGTGGYSAIFGTAVAPLGEEGYVALSVANEQFGNYRNRRYRH